MINGDEGGQARGASLIVCHKFFYYQYVCLIAVTVQNAQIQNSNFVNLIHVKLPGS